MSQVVNDRSGVVIKIGFLDSRGAHINIVGGTWTLLDNKVSQNIINLREQVSLPTRNADNFYYIGLTNNDTAFADGEDRYLIVEATYFNDLADQVMDIKSYITFKISDIAYIV